MEPDLAGFKDAQVRLTESMGSLVVFLTPEETVWPSGAVIDPESNRPLDPWVQPESSGFASAAVKCSMVYGPIKGTGDDQTVQSPIGPIREGEAAAIMFEDGYAQASGATRAIWKETNWTVSEFTKDETPERWIAFLQED